jgi:hypothetical protein
MLQDDVADNVPLTEVVMSETHQLSLIVEILCGRKRLNSHAKPIFKQNQLT